MGDYEDNDNWFDLTNHSLEEVTTFLTESFNKDYLNKWKALYKEQGLEVACATLKKGKREFIMDNVNLTEEERTYMMLLDL